MNNNITLVNFIDLNLQDKKMVLSWRNHSSIKKWMYNEQDISLEKHLEFIESLKLKSDKLYFLMKQNSDNIGVIDFTNITESSAEFGVYANIDVKGVGRLLLNSICEYGFNTLKLDVLIAEVYAKNIKAIDLYKKLKFQETHKKLIKHKEVICMELKNENR